MAGQCFIPNLIGNRAGGGDVGGEGMGLDFFAEAARGDVAGLGFIPNGIGDGRGGGS